MDLGETVTDIKRKIKASALPNEYAVTTGAVLPMLAALNWPANDPLVVYPQYKIEGKFVDFALFNSDSGSPAVFLEVKRVGGMSPKGEEQLFDYAYKSGVPLLVFTDGQRWDIYLPAGQGIYEERKLHGLDLLEDDEIDCSDRLSRYLSHNNVIRGVAFQDAWTDYQERIELRRVEQTFPRAWNQLLDATDGPFIELLAMKVEELCGINPTRQSCAAFISDVPRAGTGLIPTSSPTKPAQPQPPVPSSTPRRPSAHPAARGRGFYLHGEWFPCSTLVQVMVGVLEKLAERDPKFPERFAQRDIGRKRNYIAKNKAGLYPGRPDLASQFSVESGFGWFIGTHYGRFDVEKAVRLACQVTDLKFGSDIVIQLER